MPTEWVRQEASLDARRPQDIAAGTNFRLRGYPLKACVAPRRILMLKWALIFFVISLITGFLGFTGVSAATGGIAKILFYIFLVLLVITLIVALAIGQFVF